MLDLIEGFETQALLADIGYDAEYDIAAVGNAEAVIPPRFMRKHQQLYDKELYKERNLVERMLSSHPLLVDPETSSG